MIATDVDRRSGCRTSIRSSWLGTSFGATIIVMVMLVVWALRLPEHRDSPPPDELYLAWMRDARLIDRFDSDASALAHGKQVCRALGDGGPKQGSAEDKIAVDILCPSFVEGFHTIEIATVQGSFVLAVRDLNAETSSIVSDGVSCHGVNGYADIDRNTPVIVRNGKNEILDIGSLGDGRGDHRTCTFFFSFRIADGQDRYVVSISHRGEFIYTFNQLASQGLHIQLGG